MAGCHLVVAEGDGEPPIVPIDDLNAVVSRAAEKNNDSFFICEVSQLSVLAICFYIYVNFGYIWEVLIFGIFDFI